MSTGDVICQGCGTSWGEASQLARDLPPGAALRLLRGERGPCCLMPWSLSWPEGQMTTDRELPQPTTVQRTSCWQPYSIGSIPQPPLPVAPLGEGAAELLEVLTRWEQENGWRVIRRSVGSEGTEPRTQ